MNQPTNDCTRWLILLTEQINQLANRVSADPQQRVNQNYFDRQLFNQRAKQLSDYQLEIEKNFAQLKIEAAHQHAEQVTFLTERLVAQISALQREIATNGLRKGEKPLKKANTADNAYQNLAQHQEYKRRLTEMVSDRENLLLQQDNLLGRQKLEKELATLAGRLNRCNTAIKRLEKSIEQRDHSTYT